MGNCNDCGEIGIIHGPASMTLCFPCYDSHIRKADHYNRVRALKDYILGLRVLAEMSH